MRSQYNTLAEALVKYPNLKNTITLAKKLDYKLFSHCVQFNKSGTVNSHWFRTAQGFERNQRILSFLKHMNHKQLNTLK